MSKFLLHPSLNMFYVALLVLNCWVIALVHSLIHRSPTSRYFASLLSDLVLDIASSMFVPFAIALSYFEQMDPSSPALFGVKWFEDERLTNAVSEFRLLFVISWGDLASRLVYSVSMITTLNTLMVFVGGMYSGKNTDKSWRRQWRSIVPVTEHVESTRGSSRTLQILKLANDAMKTNLILTKRVCFLGSSSVRSPHCGGAKCTSARLRNASPTMGN